MTRPEDRWPAHTVPLPIREGRSRVRRMKAYRLDVTGPDGSTRTHRIASPVVRLGSRSGSDVTLEDEHASRVHFEIAADEHGFRLRDLGSTNGTFVEGLRAHDVYLKAGARIRAGGTDIVFEPLEDDAEVPLADADRFGPLVGGSEAMRGLFADLEKVARADATVLLEGESGTGKELVARALHQASRRAGGPFVVFDCASVPPGLIESELFGHEKGAFTGAHERRTGALPSANGGTFFLDEIGEMPIALQPSLLRALSTREVRPVGGRDATKLDVRIVAATNRDLAREVNRGAFRDDLYYRLAVVRLVIPPLRARPEDARLLVRHFVHQVLAEEPDRADALVDSIPEPDFQQVEAYDWPGNVRELRNTVERSLALAGEDARELRIELGPTWRKPAPSGGTLPALDLDRPFSELREELLVRFEEAYVTGILARTGGKIRRAAQAAGLERTYFKRLMRRRGLLRDARRRDDG